MDLQPQRLSQGEKIAAGSALGLFVCMFLGWFNFGFAVSNAWDSLHYVSPILAVVIAATLAIVVLKASGRSIGDVPGGSVVFALGCAAALLVLFRLIDPISAGDASPFGGGGVEEGSSAEAGLFLGFFATIGIALGGYLATEGRALDQVRRLFAGGGGPPASGQSPPPPPDVATSAAPLPAGPPEPTPSPPGLPLPPVEHAPLPPVEHAPLPPAEHAPLPPAEPALPPVRVPPAGGSTVFCEHCGAQIGASDRFCGGCGQATASQ